jgi:hypothetical protein
LTAFKGNIYQIHCDCPTPPLQIYSMCIWGLSKNNSLQVVSLTPHAQECVPISHFALSKQKKRGSKISPLYPFEGSQLCAHTIIRLYFKIIISRIFRFLRALVSERAHNGAINIPFTCRKNKNVFLTSRKVMVRNRLSGTPSGGFRTFPGQTMSYRWHVSVWYDSHSSFLKGKKVLCLNCILTHTNIMNTASVFFYPHNDCLLLPIK